MKVEHLKKLPAILISVFLFLAPAVPAFAAKPYFKTYGSDIMTGGWFAEGGTCDTSTYYQDPSFSNAGAGIGADSHTGGILAFAKKLAGSNKPDGGASSQYAAYSIGQVDGDDTSNGIYTLGADINSNSRVTDLTFANNNLGASPWGGLFEGSVKQSHCIPDYYAQKPASTTNMSGLSLNSVIGTNDSYSASPAAGTNFSLTSGSLTIPENTKINVYVNGSVYIGNNITYGASTADHVPKFRLVAKGSIYIGPGVTNLDGWYVAQPDTSLGAAQLLNGDTGILWTCHANDQSNPTDVFLTTNCVNKLTVNGALVAKQYNLVRLNGDVASSNIGEDVLSGGFGSGNIAEIINYTPAMVIGGGFLTSSSSGGGPLPIDSLISLPPVF